MAPKQVDKNIIILQLLQGQLDGALRPIVYARIDSCSPKDFQYLHTVFDGKYPFLIYLFHLFKVLIL